MVVDTSAILAILLDEPDAPVFARALGVAEHVVMSAGTFLELAIVIDNHRSISATRELEALMRRASIEVIAVTAEQAHVARQAHADYGRGNHPAKLNFGDCFAYALAKERGEPLLFKGQDFAHTDIEAAI